MVELKLDSITHSYDGKNNAIENVSITFQDKTANSLLGPSGCGKTTLLKIIAGLLKPSEGRVYFDGRDVTDLPPEERNIAMVFQFPVVYDMSVLDNLMFPLLNAKLSKEQKRAKALRAAETLELKPILDQSAPRLGPADRQRVALGRVLVREPDVFLFDEPLSSIEPEKRDLLKVKIKETQKKLAQTTIFVTHDQTEALTFADKVAVMNNGRIIQFDTVENIYKQPKNVFVGLFVGFPGMNIIDGTIKGNTIYLDDFSIGLPQKADFPKNLTKVKIGIRPEHVEVSETERSGWNLFRSVNFENLAKGYGILHLVAGHQKIKARSKFYAPPGSHVWVDFPPQYIHVFNAEGNRYIA